jgi:hypothetical protein
VEEQEELDKRSLERENVTVTVKAFMAIGSVL